MSQKACCTCATLLANAPHFSSTSEKPLPKERQLDCCGRVICGDCIYVNPRFLDYCPYCQTSGRSPLLSTNRTSQRPSERESGPDSNPPPYSAIAPAISPPPYTPSFPRPRSSPPQPDEKKGPVPNPDSQPAYTIHHLRHPPHPEPDTIVSLSLRYGIPASVLRQHNKLPPDADYLLAARHTLLIPTAHITRRAGGGGGYQSSNGDGGGLSLSPHPVEDEGERERKTAIRRWMVACKEADYDTAVVYLEESRYDFAEAIRRYWDDVAWERAHPLESHTMGKWKGRGRKKGLSLGSGLGKREGAGWGLGWSRW
ncbi:hypothetical protein C8A03DRAFT_11226 [Achaetomium macrosporum]|uniref:LysM domain-containing protein n=1 Tax=Achaetomium macrosporum TaxID=79813 RepID=A0AAN7CIA3_9PEZI|nr:hypothetical protein C8A03DRAFT_11226 [Achaetomium macrosporum]